MLVAAQPGREEGHQRLVAAVDQPRLGVARARKLRDLEVLRPRRPVVLAKAFRGLEAELERTCETGS